MLSKKLFVEVPVAAQPAGQHACRPRLLEDALLYLRPGRAQLLRDVHYRHDHYQQPRTGELSAGEATVNDLSHSYSISMGQIIKSVCVCHCVSVSVCPSVGTLTVAFLDRFSPKLAQT